MQIDSMQLVFSVLNMIVAIGLPLMVVVLLVSRRSSIRKERKKVEELTKRIETIEAQIADKENL